MLDSSLSDGMLCAGSMPSGWCISWILSPICIGAAQQHMRKLIWNFYADLKVYRLNPGKRGRRALGRGSIASSAAVPALSRWIDC